MPVSSPFFIVSILVHSIYMFDSLPHTLREYGLPGDVRTLLLLRKAIEKDLVHTLGDMYVVLKGVCVRDPKLLGPFTQAFYMYFLEINIGKGEKLNAAIARSKAFKDWKEMFIEDHPEREALDMRELIDQFLNEVHLTSYEIKDLLKGEDILSDDDPDMKDNGGDDETPENLKIDRAADYRNVDVEELRRRMRKVMEQQKGKHFGGSHWIGQGGVSPYGNSGAAEGGIRVGGKGGGKMARAVVDDGNYYPVDLNQRLNDNNVDAALSYLKGIREETAERELHIKKTITEGLKQGGLFLPIEREIIERKLQVILLIDNGGYSMDPYIRSVTSLFKKMKTRFSHDLETYYFHNTIYDRVYEDARRSKRIAIEKLLDKDPNYRIFIVGDAAMAPYELNQMSYNSWTALKDKFDRIAWLNPMHKSEWAYTQTTVFLQKIIPMYALTPKGIEKAVRDMNQKKDELYVLG